MPKTRGTPACRASPFVQSTSIVKKKTSNCSYLLLFLPPFFFFFELFNKGTHSSLGSSSRELKFQYSSPTVDSERKTVEPQRAPLPRKRGASVGGVSNGHPLSIHFAPHIIQWPCRPWNRRSKSRGIHVLYWQSRYKFTACFFFFSDNPSARFHLQTYVPCLITVALKVSSIP